MPNQQIAGPGSIGIRLVDVPEDSRDDPQARVFIVERVAPGTSIRRRVEVINTTRSTVNIAVYSAAASLRRGRFGLAPGRTRNELSSWTRVSQGVLRLAPGTKTFETVTINVPKHASPGKRYAVIWAQASARAPAAGGVTLVNRVGVRMYVTVGKGGAPPANFAVSRLTAKRSANGVPLVVARVHNSGGRALQISGNLTLSQGLGGVRAGPFSVQLGTVLAAGDSEAVTVRLDKRLARGPWRAHMRLRSGLIQRVAVATITFPARAGTAKPPGGSSDFRHLIGVLLILLGFLGASAFVLRCYRPSGLRAMFSLLR
jgi:hypothetical protein